MDDTVGAMVPLVLLFLDFPVFLSITLLDLLLLLDLLFLLPLPLPSPVLLLPIMPSPLALLVPFPLPLPLLMLMLKYVRKYISSKASVCSVSDRVSSFSCFCCSTTAETVSSRAYDVDASSSVAKSRPTNEIFNFRILPQVLSTREDDDAAYGQMSKVRELKPQGALCFFKAAKRVNSSCNLPSLASCFLFYRNMLFRFVFALSGSMHAKFFPKLFVQETGAPKTTLTLLFSLYSTEAPCLFCHWTRLIFISRTPWVLHLCPGRNIGPLHARRSLL